jgi:hypothetical protein
MSDWLTARDIAERLQISRSAAFGLMRKLPRLKMGRITRVSEQVLERYLTQHMKPGNGADVEPAESERRRTVELEQLNRNGTARKRSLPNAPPRIPLTRPRETVDDPPPRPKIRHTRQPPLLPVPEAPPRRPTGRRDRLR